MRLLVLNANTTAEITERCAAAAREQASAGVEIVGLTGRRGARIINTRAENALAAATVIELLAEHGPGADGALIAVSFDTALDAAREAMPFPVVGMTEAALHVASMLGGRIGFVGPGARTLGVYRDTVARTGLSGRIAGWRAIDFAAADYLDPEPALVRVDQAIDSLVAEGAESIVVAGAALAGFRARLQEAAPVPIVDGIGAGVSLLEALVRLKLPRARAGSHAVLPKREVDGFGEPVRRLFGG
jgi:allantoin racemase